MRKKRRHLLLAGLVLIALLAGLAGLGSLHREPVYQGKRLSKWLSFLKPGMVLDPGAVQAVQQAGTNAFPTLLRMLRERDSNFKLKLIGLTQKQHLMNLNLVSAEQRNWEAVQAFTILGAGASNAVPDLIQIFGESISDVSRQLTARALGGIGPAASAAVPVLLREATNTSASLGVRGYSIAALGGIRANPESVVPVLVSCLDKQADPNVQIFALQALANFGSDAKAAVPALVQLLNARETWVRPVARQVLKAIDPEAAAKAGSK